MSNAKFKTQNSKLPVKGSNFTGAGLGVTAIALYLLGGVGTFGGLALVAFMKGRDLFGWGDGRSIGWLFLCGGICLSIIGVLLMRIFRNRGFA